MYHCKICQSTIKSVVDTEKNLTYHRCLACGFVYLDNRHRVESIREKQQYLQHNNGFENEGYVQMFESFLDHAVAPYLPIINSALDFGSGPGPVLSTLLERRGVEEVDIYDLYFSPERVYEGKSYDLITSTEVFEHLHKPLEIVEMLVNHLNAEGYLIVMTKFPPKEDRLFLDWWYRRDPTHISFFTPESFEVMAESVGLKVLRILNDNVVVFQKC